MSEICEKDRNHYDFASFFGGFALANLIIWGIAAWGVGGERREACKAAIAAEANKAVLSAVCK